MAEDFDPYLKWLGIPSSERPVNHYRLLGVPLFIDDLDVIQSGADRQMAHLRTFQTGKNADASQRLLNEVSAARVCLLKRDTKEVYDQQLKARLLPPPVPPRTTVKQVVLQPLANSDQPISASASKRHLTSRRPEATRRLNQFVRKLPFVVSLALVLVMALYFYSRTSRRDPRIDSNHAVDAKQLKNVAGVMVAEEASPSGNKSEIEATDAEQPVERDGAKGEVRTVQSAADVKAKYVGEWIDLLEWAEGFDWKARGIDWTAECRLPPSKFGIEMKSLPFKHLPLPATIDGDYELEVEFERHTGGQSVNVFFPIGVHNMHLELGAIGGEVGGVHWIDGKNALEGNPTSRRPSVFSNNQKHRIVIRASRSEVSGKFEVDWNDQSKYIQWEGAYSSLTNMDWSPWRLSTIGHVWLGSWGNSLTFSKARIRMINGRIVRDGPSNSERANDLENGLVRLVGEHAERPTTGWGGFLVNQVPLDARPGECERLWPRIAEDYSLCEEFFGAYAPSRIKCRIPKGATSFSAIGYNDASRSTIFRVIEDGARIFESGITDIARVRVDLHDGAEFIELAIDSAGYATSDYSYWCYPKFHRVKAAAVTDKMLEERGSDEGLRFVVESSSVGLGTLTHNEPIRSSFSTPLHIKSTSPCFEFLFAHADSEVTYKVREGMNRFTATGYCLRSHDVKFEVWVDSKRIFMSPQAGIVAMDVKLPAGTKMIALKVKNLGDQNGDTSFWCYPRLHSN